MSMLSTVTYVRAPRLHPAVSQVSNLPAALRLMDHETHTRLKPQCVCLLQVFPVAVRKDWPSAMVAHRKVQPNGSGGRTTRPQGGWFLPNCLSSGSLSHLFIGM